uniref:Uncharacterized protein n=1 Tax=Trieres chinensis TaxID=1514140 RepID=A0A7S2A130_TRICV|mmetsp:Transcript_37537/g.76574  ORF Transcript_37537/g.76574 Transcript_37537/m.76574 type:complete len:205 (+) Transcript_37537:142-756(+)
MSTTEAFADDSEEGVGGWSKGVLLVSAGFDTSVGPKERSKADKNKNNNLNFGKTAKDLKNMTDIKGIKMVPPTGHPAASGKSAHGEGGRTIRRHTTDGKGDEEGFNTDPSSRKEHILGRLPGQMPVWTRMRRASMSMLRMSRKSLSMMALRTPVVESKDNCDRGGHRGGGCAASRVEVLNSFTINQKEEGVCGDHCPPDPCPIL